MKRLLQILFLSIPLLLQAEELNLDALSSQLGDISASEVAAQVAQSRQMSLQQQERMEVALASLAIVKDGGRYISSITDLANGLITLPVGIKNKTIGGTLVIDSLIRTSSGQTQLKISFLYKFKDNDKLIAFDGKIDIDAKKGFGNGGSIELVAPISRPMGDKGEVIFMEGTKATIVCDGIQSVTANILILLNSGAIIPVDKQGNPTNDSLAVSTQTTFYDFDNYTLSVDIDKSFKFKELDDVIFSLQSLVLDQSDTETPSKAQFPSDYWGGGDSEERNLWKGLYVSAVEVGLPAFIKADPNDSTNASRVTLLGDNILLDNNGFTGTLSGDNAFPTERLNRDNFCFSVNHLSLSLHKNSLEDFSFMGDINVPAFKDSSLIPYEASYLASDRRFDFDAEFSGQRDFEALSSTLEITQGNVNIDVVEDDFDVTLTMGGNISVDVSDKGFELPSVEFTGMRISSAEPHFGLEAIELGGEVPMNFDNFPVTVKSIEPFTEGGETGLAFNAILNVSEKFGGEGGFKLYGNYKDWEYDRLGVESIDIHFEIEKAFSLNGSATFFEDDPIYGKGFSGTIYLDVIEKFNVEATGLFGNVDGYRYFYTDGTLRNLTVQAGPLTFTEFGGGAYSRMQQTAATGNTSLGITSSGMAYKPDQSVGLGLIAATRFKVASDNALQASLLLELQFNRSWGLNFVELRGEAASMAEPSCLTNLSERVSKVNASKDNFTGDSKGAKLTQGELAAEQDRLASNLEEGIVEIDNSLLLLPKPSFNAPLMGNARMKYDNINKFFSFDMSLYVNAAGGTLRGLADDDKAGSVSAFFSESDWRFLAGSPVSPIGLRISLFGEVSSYFMMGKNLPLGASYPQELIDFMGDDLIEAPRSQKLNTGDGIAFGLGLSHTADISFLLFYAKLQASLGTDFSLLKIPNPAEYCPGWTDEFGIKGWYANAGVYAHLLADMGMRVKMFSIDKKMPFAKVEAGAVLTGAGPSPYSFAGSVKGEYDLLGGTLKGDCNLQFTIGSEACKGSTETSPFAEDVIISQTPSDKKEVSVFVSPQTTFLYPVNEVIEITEIDDEDNEYTSKYRIIVNEIALQGPGNPEGRQRWNKEKTAVTFEPKEALNGEEEYTFITEIAFQKMVNGVWETQKEGEKDAIENKKIKFTSGKAPTTLDKVAYSYPAAKHYNFYKDETGSNIGYIQSAVNDSYLFDRVHAQGIQAGEEQILRWTYGDGTIKESTITEVVRGIGNHSTHPLIKFNLPDDMENDKIYTMSIVNIPTAISNIDIQDSSYASVGDYEGNSLNVTRTTATGNLVSAEERIIYSMSFRTSQYDTFGEKIEALEVQSGILLQEMPNLYSLAGNVYDKEADMFDGVEHRNAPNYGKSWIRMSPDYANTAWYTREIAPLIYENKSLLRKANMEGLKPPGGGQQMIEYNGQTDNFFLTEEVVANDSRLTVSPWGALNYRVPHYMQEDFMLMRNELANRLVSSFEFSNEVEDFLSHDHLPELEKGNYPVNVEYVIPGCREAAVQHQITLKLESDAVEQLESEKENKSILGYVAQGIKESISNSPIASLFSFWKK